MVHSYIQSRPERCGLQIYAERILVFLDLFYSWSVVANLLHHSKFCSLTISRIEWRSYRFGEWQPCWNHHHPSFQRFFGKIELILLIWCPFLTDFKWIVRFSFPCNTQVPIAKWGPNWHLQPYQCQVCCGCGSHKLDETFCTSIQFSYLSPVASSCLAASFVSLHFTLSEPGRSSFNY